MDLKTALDKIAQQLVDEVTGNDKKDVPFSDIIDTFKELRAYYALTLKEKTDSDNDEPGGFDFANGIGDGHAGRVPRRGNS